MKVVETSLFVSIGLKMWQTGGRLALNKRTCDNAHLARSGWRLGGLPKAKSFGNWQLTCRDQPLQFARCGLRLSRPCALRARANAGRLAVSASARGGRCSDEARCQSVPGRQTGKGADLLTSFAEGMAASRRSGRVSPDGSWITGKKTKSFRSSERRGVPRTGGTGCVWLTFWMTCCWTG